MIDTRQTSDNIEALLKALENPREQPTRWELEFLTNIREQFDRRGHLSTRQFDILERIAGERT